MSSPLPYPFGDAASATGRPRPAGPAASSDGPLPLQRDRSIGAHHDTLDVSLDDDDLRAETELVISLIAAANDSDQPLDQHEIDHLLGLAC